MGMVLSQGMVAFRNQIRVGTAQGKPYPSQVPIQDILDMKTLLTLLLFSLNVNAADIRQMIVSQCSMDSALAVKIQSLRQKTNTTHSVYNSVIRQTASNEMNYQKQLDVGRVVYSWPKDMPVRSVYGKYLRSCLKEARDHL